MPRPSNRDARRAQIIDGLMLVLPEVGYERATIVRIAKAAGLSPGLVHHHFRNKLEILLALADRLVELVRARTPEARTPRRRLHAYLDAHLALGHDTAPHAVACWVALGAEAVFQPEVSEVYRRIALARQAQLLDLLREICRHETRSARGLDVLAASLLAMIEGFFQIASTTPTIIPRGSAASAARSVADKLLDAQPSHPRRST